MQDKINAGVEFLNSNISDWLDRIDLEYLDMRDCCRCVLGQIFGQYHYGIEYFSLTYDQLYEYGFTAFDEETWLNVDLTINCQELWDRLTNAWEIKIQELKEKELLEAL